MKSRIFLAILMAATLVLSALYAASMAHRSEHAEPHGSPGAGVRSSVLPFDGQPLALTGGADLLGSGAFIESHSMRWTFHESIGLLTIEQMVHGMSTTSTTHFFDATGNVIEIHPADGSELLRVEWTVTNGTPGQPGARYELRRLSPEPEINAIDGHTLEWLDAVEGPKSLDVPDYSVSDPVRWEFQGQ